MKVKIYCGLSITETDVVKILPTAIAARPICRGDLISDIKNGVHVVGIIDGVFYHQLAVSPGEILDAIRSGVKVLGASSMGALRAAELAPFGMVGVGSVYEFISSSSAFEDDFLGQLFVGERPEQAALIDLILELHRLGEKGVLTARQVARAIGIGRAHHFAVRDIRDIARRICDDRHFARVKPQLLSRLKSVRSFKRADGIQLLKVVKKHQIELQAFNRRPPRLSIEAQP